MVLRYDPVILQGIPQSDGDYVLYEDYEKLKYRLDRCHDKLRDLHQELFPEGKIT